MSSTPEMPADSETFACGCQVGNAGYRMFVKPCGRPGCQVEKYVAELAEEHDVPVQGIDLSQVGRHSGALRDALCPHCGHGADGYSGPKPKPGDVGICVHCSGVQVITETGMRKPTTDEMKIYDADPEIEAYRAAITAGVIRGRRPRR